MVKWEALCLGFLLGLSAGLFLGLLSVNSALQHQAKVFLEFPGAKK